MNITNLHPEAQKLYKELIILISNDNALALNMLVITYSTYLEATEHLQLEGKVLQEFDYNNNPKTKPNPWVKIQLDSQIQLHKLIQEFGLTPKSKNKINSNSPGASPLEVIMNKLVETR